MGHHAAGEAKLSDFIKIMHGKPNFVWQKENYNIKLKDKICEDSSHMLSDKKSKPDAPQGAALYDRRG